jgi:hypothetical protein
MHRPTPSVGALNIESVQRLSMPNAAATEVCTQLLQTAGPVAAG